MLTENEVNIIVENTVIKNFRKDTILLEEGEVSKECYFVLKGCVREYYMVDGEEKTTAFFTENQPVTAFSSYSNEKPSKHYLVCAEDCILTVGTQELEKEMCDRIPRLEAVIRQEVEKHTGKLQDDLSAFITSTPEKRFLNLLDANPSIFNRFPQYQIASYLGITPESFSRIKKRVFSKKD